MLDPRTLEENRLRFIEQRDDTDAAKEFAERTLKQYEEALSDPLHFASQTQYLPQFEASCEVFRRYLHHR